MYMYLRYPTQCIANNTALSTNSFHPDMPDIFLNWNVEDPVSQVELQRNDILHDTQGNRNPFIDNPYIATMIWNGNAAQDSWDTLSVDDESDRLVLFSIFPNPADDVIQIKQSGLDIILVNLTGQVLIKAKNINQLDVSTLEDGFYIRQLSSDKGQRSLNFLKN